MWQIALFLLAWGLTSAVAGFVLGRLFRTPPGPPPVSTGLREGEFRVPREWTGTPPRQDYLGYGGYGQKPAPVLAPVPMRVINPVPRAPKK